MKNSSLLIHPDELNKKWIDRAADEGIKTLGIHPVGGSQAEKFVAELVETLKTKEFRGLIDYAISKGLKIEYEMHAGGYLLNRALFDTHPEYFRMYRNGERHPDGNFCVSNEQALEIVSDRAVRLAQALYGSEHNYFLWLEDGRDQNCKCPACADISPSDGQLKVLNRMLEKIRVKIPDARLAFLAYCDTMQVPTAEKPSDGIFLEYAPFAKYSKEPDAEMIAGEHEMLVPLMEFFGKKDARVLEYWFDNSLFSRWKKPPVRFTPDADAIRRDIKMYRELGFENITSFACYLGEDYEALYGEPDVSPFMQAIRNA